jgi:uncharacterized protein YceH (UPF0502 family)
MHDAATATAAPVAARWQPLESAERRVLGVLVEKAKTTPESYPLSLNAIRTGSNQKNNRAPVMQLEDEQVEAALDSLRRVGAVVVIEGSGRVDKYRHLAYDWLGVEKVELAVMAELLLRGAQTVGELRGRAARMEPIKDLDALRPVLDSLEVKRLISYLTPAGRGAIVTHALYQDRELDKLRRETVLARPQDDAGREAAGTAGTDVGATENVNVATELRQLRDELAAAKREFAAARAEFESTTRQLRSDLDELNRQLGN